MRSIQAMGYERTNRTAVGHQVMVTYHLEFM